MAVPYGILEGAIICNVDSGSPYRNERQKYVRFWWSNWCSLSKQRRFI